MATIDVATEVVLSDDIAAIEFAVLRRRSWTTRNGLERHQNRRISPVFGSLFPGGNNGYDREDSFQLMNKGLEIVTRFLLRSVATTRGNVEWQPDIIVFAGSTFLVKEVKDFTQYGPGFVYCAADSFDYTGIPPRGTDPKVGWMNFGDRRYSGLLGVTR